MTLSNSRILFIIVTILFFPRGVSAGLDSFSYLDKVGDWVIERKIDSLKETIYCRASILKHGSWFGSRVRLARNDELVFPSELSKKEIPSKSIIKRVKRALEICRSGYIYTPQVINE